MFNFPTLFRQNQIKQPYSCSLIYQNPLLLMQHALIINTSFLSKPPKFPLSATVETLLSTFLSL